MVTAAYGDRSSEVCGGEVVESLNARSAMGAVSPGTARATTMFAMSAEGAEKSWSKQEDGMTNETYTPDDLASDRTKIQERRIQMTDECPICKNDEEPCAKCRRQIHESWHAIGCWWIRPEECHPGCPGYKPTVDLGPQRMPATEPRLLAQEKQRAMGGPWLGLTSEEKRDDAETRARRRLLEQQTKEE